MTIDISKIKPGDYVTVRAKCTHKTECSIELNALNSHLGSFWVPLSSVVGHEPAPEPLKIGDVVIVAGNTLHHKIIGMLEDYAWIKNDYYVNGFASMHVSQLRRVEKP